MRWAILRGCAKFHGRVSLLLKASDLRLLKFEQPLLRIVRVFVLPKDKLLLLDHRPIREVMERVTAAIASFPFLISASLPSSPFSQSTATVPGSIDGDADVPLSGSAHYAIPIHVPPGTGGTAPLLGLLYDCQVRGGPSAQVGRYRGCQGSRAGQPTSGPTTSVQRPLFGSSDALFLDGQRLIPVAGGTLPCGSGAGFIKEVDDQTCVETTRNGFTVRTKAGLTMQYALTTDSLVTLADPKLPLL